MALWEELAEAAGRVGWHDVERGWRTASRTAEEAAYVAVGLGVLGFQRAQVHRLALQRRLAGEAGGVAGCILGALRQVRAAARPG